MQLVVLDGYTLNPGDLSWEPLRALAHCHIYDRTSAAELQARAAGAEALLTNKTVLDAAALELMPRLQYIGVLATGYNVVDIRAARRRNIPVTNVPTYGTQSVAQMTFALLLELTQHVGHHAQSVREGQWSRSADFCYWHFPLVELEGLVMGIVGFGRIGRAVARLAAAFGMRILASDPSPPPGPELEVEFVGLAELFRRSDVVSLHCPLTAETQGFVTRDYLRLMKDSALLLNTSRGPLIDEEALAETLNSSRIAGAGLDVLSVEPPPADHPLMAAKNCLITPHIAWATRNARARLLRVAIENLKSFLEGTPQNVVNL